ncbi:MAG: hypothetical protein JNN07_13760 [Verrucomicrobiales bacterium]|nr:hypothetical protein [Verrucomicrobiales bacterium]
MNRFLQNGVLLLLGWLTVQPICGLAGGFPPNHLLATDSSALYLIDPATGNQTPIASFTDAGDVVYNPVSESAFVVAGNDIVQVTSTSAGYVSSIFVHDVADLQCLAVDGFGRVIFNEEDFVRHQLWRANLDGQVTALTTSDFFVPRHMTYGRDYSKLYVFETPANRVSIVDSSSGKISSLAGGLDFPPGGDVSGGGDLFVLEDFSSAKVTRITPDGARTTYASQSWMNFTSFDDLVYDDGSGVIYTTSTSGLYALNPDLTSRKISQGNGWYRGLSMIRPGLPVLGDQPRSQIVALGTPALFSVTVKEDAGTSYQWRKNGTDIPGATERLFSIASVEAQDAGLYSVRVITSGGAAISTEASLSLLQFSVAPVVTLVGPVGGKFRVEFKEHVAEPNTWQFLTDITTTSTSTDVVDHTATNAPQRFYRVLPMP